MTAFTRTRQLEQLERLGHRAAGLARLQLTNGLPALAEKTVVDAMKSQLKTTLSVARAAGATHRDTRDGHTDTFYKPAYPNGPMLEMSVNGTAGQWQRSKYDHCPDWAIAI